MAAFRHKMEGISTQKSISVDGLSKNCKWNKDAIRRVNMKFSRMEKKKERRK